MRSSFVFYVQVVSDTKSEKTKSKKDEANGQAQSQASMIHKSGLNIYRDLSVLNRLSMLFHGKSNMRAVFLSFLLNVPLLSRCEPTDIMNYRTFRHPTQYTWSSQDRVHIILF